ncbi:hypothetical protein JCM18897A_55760 [Streptomyces sp. JCM 18897]
MEGYFRVVWGQADTAALLESSSKARPEHNGCLRVQVKSSGGWDVGERDVGEGRPVVGLTGVLGRKGPARRYRAGLGSGAREGPWGQEFSSSRVLPLVSTAKKAITAPTAATTAS